MNKSLKTLLIIAAIIMPFFMFSSAFADAQGQNVSFSVNEGFDKLGRSSMTATLRHISENAYFYVDDDYWNTLGFSGRQNLMSGISELASDFDATIYPTETSFWGQEPKPGVDGDNRITILLEQLKSGNGGYFSTSNGYPKTSAPDSNEREMVVISAESVSNSYTRIFLAHEFQHLISFNQKELLRDVTEDVWLNELRSEYSVTLIGYNNIFNNSNLERRAETFFDNPSDSLTEWPNASLAYSSVALFAGWLAANYINDGSVDSRFSYANAGLKNFKASPQRLTILSGSESSVFDYSLKPWQGYGHKFLVSGALSGDKAIKLSPAFNSRFAYADNLGRFSVLDKEFYVNDPGGLEYFYIFPINDKKISDFGKEEVPSFLTLTMKFEEKTLGIDFGSVLKDGVLKKKEKENETYVIEGKKKR